MISSISHSPPVQYYQLGRKNKQPKREVSVTIAAGLSLAREWQIQNAMMNCCPSKNDELHNSSFTDEGGMCDPQHGGAKPFVRKRKTEKKQRASVDTLAGVG